MRDILYSSYCIKITHASHYNHFENTSHAYSSIYSEQPYKSVDDDDGMKVCVASPQT